MNEKSIADKDKKKQKPGKAQGPNTILVLVVLCLLIIVLYKIRREDDQKDETYEPQAAPSDIITTNLSDLGRVVGIGPSAMSLKIQGTDVIKAEDVPGLAELLEGQDVDAVADVLSKVRIEHLIVDPSIAKRHPIPKNTVKNRLALANPAGRLTAVLLSKQLFHYRLGPGPLELPQEAKRALISVARNTFNGGSGDPPSGAPSIINQPGDWTVILTVRPMQNRHISFHSIRSSTLAKAASKAGEKARRYYQSRGFDRKLGPLSEALARRITVELEVMYDVGLYVGPRDSTFVWRIIEPGIYGILMTIEGKNHYLPPWYSVANNYRLVDDLFKRIVKNWARKESNYWKNSRVPFHRFRTLHWRERTPGGDVEDLYRLSPRVPTMKDVTRENMVKSLQGLGDWIADNQHKLNGQYMYRYFPTKDEENEEYNMVRHALGPFSMALTHEFAPDPKYKEKAEAGMKYIEDHIRWGGPPRKGDGTIDASLTSWMGKPLPGPDVAILDHRDLDLGSGDTLKGDWTTKMGAVAVAILGYTQFKRVGWELSPEREKVLKGLSNFLLYMQNPEEGNFHHYYAAPDNSYYRSRNSIYPGEILYAVARLYGETRDERFRTAFKQSKDANLKWFKEQMAQKLADGTYEEEHRKNLVQFQPWMAMAMDEMYRYDPDPSYVEASNLVSLWILDTYQYDDARAQYPDYLGGYLKVLDELPAMHTFVYTEGTAASWDLARRAGADPQIVEKLRKGALLSARFIIQQQSRPGENDFYYPNWRKARGGVRYCMNHNKQRIDYTYHALSSVYRIIRAATEEDYAYAESIPMPRAW